MESLCLIPVYAGGIVVCEARVDPEDWFALAPYRWLLSGGRTRQYAAARMHGPMVYMHRLLLGLTPGDGMEGDHISGDKMDNRRSNLRAVTKGQNCQNTSGKRGSTSRHRGVSWNTASGRWVATAKANGRLHWLGAFDDEERAAEVAVAFRAEHMPYSVETA